MHETAYRTGQLFFATYARDDWGRALEIGSANVNGSLREFCPSQVHYVGLDRFPGPGVDLVADLSQGLPCEAGSFDVVLSSSALEHDPAFWETFCNAVRLLKPAGLLYLCAPSNNGFHRYPLDCWRFYPDAGKALENWAHRQGLTIELVESFTTPPEQSGWSDFIAIFSKPPHRFQANARLWQQRQAQNIWDIDHAALLHPSGDTFDMQVHAQLQAELAACQQENQQLRRQLAMQLREIDAAYRALAELAPPSDFTPAD